ncbi:hypothetical protein [Larkinella sp.]|uniref:hypothetical protein n=1 Tax=Larkinella sp. TaxID=2034517 RepID=UPI003BAD05E2
MTDDFDFLGTLQRDNLRTYKLLYPDPQLGMVVMWLYDRHLSGAFPAKTFKEDTINQAFRELFGHNRQQWQDYANKISDLNEFFLRYDEQLQVYSFKNYAIEFCQRAYDVLLNTFNPTEIEQICAKLRRDLEGAHTVEGYEFWFATNLPAFQPRMKGQIDFLERQIQESVDELRKHAYRSDASIQQALEQVVQRLDEIREQNKELTAAFHEIDRIKIHLDELQANNQWPSLQEPIDNAFVFFAEMLRDLRIVDRRIDRIQPKLRQLFGTLNQPLFNGRVERFLRHLLVESEFVRDSSGRRQLQLPENIHPLLIHISTPSLPIIERKEFPTKRFSIAQKSQQNQSDRRNAFATSAERIRRQSVVERWVGRFEQLVQQQGEAQFDSFFQAILIEENNDVDLAVRVAYRVFRQFTNNPHYSLSVDNQTLVEYKTQPSLSSWQMIVQKRQTDTLS